MDLGNTEYPSLSYMQRFPSDQLKVAQRFVRDVMVDSINAAITEIVIALAESLGLAVVSTCACFLAQFLIAALPTSTTG